MKNIKPFYDVHIDKENIGDTVERLASSVSRTLQGVVQSPIIAGTLIKNVELGTTAERVEHKLGRQILGWIVVRQDASVLIFEQPEAREDLFITLEASAPVTVSLWVF